MQPPETEASSLRHLAEIVAGTADLAAALREVNRQVAHPHGVHVAACSLVNPQLRAATGAPAPSADELAAVAQWRASLRHGTTAEPLPDPAGVLTVFVPVVHRHRVHGVVRVEAEAADAHRWAEDLLPAIGLACGEVAWKAGVRRQLARNRRRLAIAVEQERTTRSVQDSVHRRLAVMGDRLAAHLAAAPDRVWRERLEELLLLTGEVDRDVRQWRNVLRTLPVQGDDLPTSLRAVAKEMAAETDLFVKVFIDGEPRRLSVARTDALFHVAVESLATAALEARAVNAVVVLEFRADSVRLVVRDDGVGLSQRNVFAKPASHGIRGAQQRLSHVGGTLRLHGQQPRGAEVEATIPTRRGAA